MMLSPVAIALQSYVCLFAVMADSARRLTRLDAALRQKDAVEGLRVSYFNKHVTTW